jgi:HSP20 family protein
MISPLYHLVVGDRFPFDHHWPLLKSGFSFVPVDVKETKDSIVFRCELAGVPQENVSVDFKDGRLVISGKKDEKKDEKGLLFFCDSFSLLGDKWHRVESHSGEFHRSFNLPKGIEASHISAAFDNGVLLVTVQKPADLKQANAKIAIHSKL